MPRSAVDPRPQPSGRPVCQYCFAWVEPSAAYCSEACKVGYWMIVPTIDGSVAEPEPIASEGGGREPERRLPHIVLEPEFAATADERTYIQGACGPRS